MVLRRSCRLVRTGCLTRSTHRVHCPEYVDIDPLVTPIELNRSGACCTRCRRSACERRSVTARVKLSILVLSCRSIAFATRCSSIVVVMVSGISIDWRSGTVQSVVVNAHRADLRVGPDAVRGVRIPLDRHVGSADLAAGVDCISRARGKAHCD
jgi:hypothetical protein